MLAASVSRVRLALALLAGVAALEASASGGRGIAALGLRGDGSIGSTVRVFVAGGLEASGVALIVDTESGDGLYEGTPLCVANGPEATIRTGTLGAKHIKVFSYAIPDEPALVGRTLHFQAVIDDPRESPWTHHEALRVLALVRARRGDPARPRRWRRPPPSASRKRSASRTSTSRPLLRNSRRFS